MTPWEWLQVLANDWLMPILVAAVCAIVLLAVVLVVIEQLDRRRRIRKHWAEKTGALHYNGK